MAPQKWKSDVYHREHPIDGPALQALHDTTLLLAGHQRVPANCATNCTLVLLLGECNEGTCSHHAAGPDQLLTGSARRALANSGKQGSSSSPALASCFSTV